MFGRMLEKIVNAFPYFLGGGMLGLLFLVFLEVFFNSLPGFGTKVVVYLPLILK